MNSVADGADRLIDEILGYRKAKVLMVAAYLELFARLESPRTAAELARALRKDARALEILLDALAAMGYLRKSGGRYRNSPLASRHLVPGRPGYLGDNLKYQEIIWDAWSELRECLQRGGAVRPLAYWLTKHPRFTDEYIRGMSNIARRPAEEIAAAVGPVARVLDVGAGPGSYSLAFLRANPGASAVLLDLPSTLKVTRRLLSAHPESRRVTLRAGDYTRDRFGEGEFDLVLLSHITHDESPATNRLMIEKAWRALAPGGRVVIHDFMLDDSRLSPVFGALFSVHMLTYTSGGRTYTAREYASWLRQAGFSRLSRRKIANKSRNATEILVGVKAA